MRLTDFTISKCQSPLFFKRRMLRLAVLCDLDDIIILYGYQQLQKIRSDIARISIRSLTISANYFNLNIFTEQESLSLFRLRTKEIVKVADVLGWRACNTTRNRSRCNIMNATCIVLRRIASPCRWVDMGFMFRMHASRLREVFWKVIETFVSLRGGLFESFHSDIINQRASLYAEAIHTKVAPLDNCLGFIDCTKIQMRRPGGSSMNQRSCYAGHERFHCLLYQTITTPDGLMFDLYGPEVGRRHDMTLLRESGLDQQIQDNMIIYCKQYCLYGDAVYILRAYIQGSNATTWATDVQKI